MATSKAFKMSIPEIAKAILLVVAGSILSSLADFYEAKQVIPMSKMEWVTIFQDGLYVGVTYFLVTFVRNNKSDEVPTLNK